MNGRWFASLVAGAALLAAAESDAAEWSVGPGKDFSRIEDALAKARSGDTILVYPREEGSSGPRPYEKAAVLVRKPKITFKAVPKSKGDRVPISGTGFDYSGRGSVPRAIFQFDPDASLCVLDGFDLSGAHNDSHNGAGLRINQANDVVIRNCRIHGNDMGIMSNGNATPRTAVNQWIESCLIHSNGDEGDPGHNHNLYLGGTSATLVACEVHSSVTGHNVKSRAHRTSVLYCHVHDSSNREFDLVDAKGDTTAADSHAVLLGNIIVKARNCQGNRAVIHFGQDGGNEHDGTLYLIHNTIVTPYISPVVHLSAAGAKAYLADNIVWDASSGQRGQKLVQTTGGGNLRETVSGFCNWLSGGLGGKGLADLGLEKTYVAAPGHNPPFVNPPKGDFHLAGRDGSIVDAGRKCEEIPLPAEFRTRLYEYKAPLGRGPRGDDGRPDLGAHECAP